jgi:hexosaminidase
MLLIKQKTRMKWWSRKLILVVSFLALVLKSEAQDVCPILPTPSSYTPSEGFVEVAGKLAINEDGIPEPIREFMIKKCVNELGLITVFTPVAEQLVFKKLYNVPKDHYSIRIDKGITIQYSSEVSCFYALTSLFQLMEKQDGKYMFRRCFVSDAPKYEWRGMHLDVSRHFFTLDEVKRYIDLMAQYKFNTFHWHLTDDQGWRIEIKKYPKLTSVGAWRDSTVNAHYSTTPRTYTKERYGGFYTQDQIKEVVAYAAERYITVVPEIEMPGHARAALAAYPQYSCTGEQLPVPGLWGVFDDIFCMHESTLDFVKDILNEVVPLFPSSYIHIGGDEAPKTRWKKCKKCQAVIRENGLKNEEELQSWFIGKIDDYLTSKGKKLIGWDEILEGGLSKNAAVMSWRGTEGGIDAAKQGHYTVMSPGSHCYFDHYQSKDRNEPLAIGGFTPLEKVYEFDPVPTGASPDVAAYILGGQANLWTEYIPDMNQLEYMAFPRAVALSEALWCQKKPEFEQFRASLVQYHFKRLKDQNVNFSRAIFYPEMKLFKKDKKVGLVFKSSNSSDPLKLTISGPEGKLENKVVTPLDTVFLNRTKGDLKHAYSYVIQPEFVDKSFTYELTAHSSLAFPIKLVTSPDPRYAGEGAFTLTDGMIGTLPWKGSDWLGFDEEKITLEMDFQKKTDISGFNLGLLFDEGSWIYYPKKISVFVSKNAKKWKQVTQFLDKPFIGRQSIFNFKVKARYMKIELEAPLIEQGLPGAGHLPWTFIDELILYFEP